MKRETHSSQRFVASFIGICCLAAGAIAYGNETEASDACDAEIANSEVLETEGAVIGKILLDRRQIFNLHLPQENKRLYRLANRYHALTRESTIRNQLLVVSGDRYTKQRIEESERILRRKSYLIDVSIVPVRYVGGVVDLCVSTRDVWTLLPGISYQRSGGENESAVSIEDSNIAGTGTALNLKYKSDTERDTVRIGFSDPQIGRSRVALATSFEDNSDGDRSFLGIERPFYALDARWSAGFGVLDDERISPLYDLGNTVAEFRQQRRFLRVSGGRSGGLRDGWVRRWTTGMVFDDNDFGPADNPLLAGPVPVDRRFVYPFLGFELLEDRFVETENQNQIGRIEDIYLGTRLTATLGWSGIGGQRNREAWLFDTGWSTGIGSPADTLWLLNAGISGRYETSKVRNALLRTRARFYHRQSKRRTFYASLTVDEGERLDLDNLVRLGGDTGLRGYPLAYQSGDRRTSLTVEQRYFTDWYPFRLFRVGAAVFADVGRIGGTNPIGGGSRGWLKDIGFGLRLGATRGSASKVLHIDFAFPLDGDESIDDVQLLIEGRRGF